MIEKIGLPLYPQHNISANFATKPNFKEKTDAKLENNNEVMPKVSVDNLKSYFVSFSGKKSDRRELAPSPAEKLDIIKYNATDKADELMKKIEKLAKNNGYNEVNLIHVLRVILDEILKYFDKLDSGEIMYEDETSLQAYIVLEDKIASNIVKSFELRKKARAVIEQEVKFLDEKIEKDAPKSSSKTEGSKNGEKTGKIGWAKDFVNQVYNLYQMPDTPELDTDSGDEMFYDSLLLDAALAPQKEDIRRTVITPFLTKLKDSAFQDKTPLAEKTHLKLYDDLAKKVWKNLDVGTNMVMLHSTGAEENVQYMITSLQKTLDASKEGFGRLNKNSTDITILKRSNDMQYVKTKINNAAKDKTKTHVFIVDITDHEGKMLNIDEDDVDFLSGVPKNVKFVFAANKDIYFSEASSGAAGEYFQDFGEVHIPIMSVKSAKEVFHSEPKLMRKAKKTFTPEAINRVIDATSALPGYYPQKAQKIFEKISSYYVDKKGSISLDDVNAYVSEAKEVFKEVNDENTVKVVFDTGVRLDDLVGSPTTKKDAQAIIERIKDKSIGTKGYIIYTQDHSVGGGRKHTAKAIAGETDSPYVEINAWDFGTKDVDIFGSGSTSPERSMSKLFGLVKSQAETSPNKSAVIFIENFEIFSGGEYFSEYHQKAMAQLIREMNRAEKQGLNILVMGSTSNPDEVDSSTSKSFKFVDMLQIESPSHNKKAREEIVKYYSKQKKMNIAGKSEKEKAEILKYVATITEYFPYIEILTLLDKAKSISRERHHKAIDKSDFTEASLQLQLRSRASVQDMTEHSKKIVTSHECGHAINGVIMYDLLTKYGKPWQQPNDKVTFITLDPRGYYNGAVYSYTDKNREMTADAVFADLVMTFGGYSAENTFYGMNGSWGITCDMESATDLASTAVGICGQGKNFGKKSLNGAWLISEHDKSQMNKDINVFLKNAEKASNMIVEAYSGFINEFTDKYSPKVGTGDCLILAETFEKELANWKKKQPKEVLDKIAQMEHNVLDALKATKEGKEYKIDQTKK